MSIRPTCIRAAVLASSCLLAATASAQVLPPVPMTLIDLAGNPADTNGVGAVAEVFRLGTFEVTNAQYILMLDAVAASDPNGLYDTLMTSSDRGGILRSGVPGAFVYSIKPDFDVKPVNGVTWYDSARFCNCASSSWRIFSQ